MFSVGNAYFLQFIPGENILADITRIVLASAIFCQWKIKACQDIKSVLQHYFLENVLEAIIIINFIKKSIKIYHLKQTFVSKYCKGKLERGGQDFFILIASSCFQKYVYTPPKVYIFLSLSFYLVTGSKPIQSISWNQVLSSEGNSC